jgi:ubiquinone/menaquinone biosynthesis C-methylase UbiE
MNHVPPDRQARVEKLGYDFAAQPKNLITSCNLCGADHLVHLTHTDRYGYPARASACAACGLTFLNPMLTRDAYSEFYRSVYRPLVSAYHNRLIDAKNIQDEQKDYARDLAIFLHPWLSKGGQRLLLDIGGSTGVVALELGRQFPLKITVLEPAAAELDWAIKAGVEPITGFLEDYDPGDRRFDFVTLCQTIDHLTDASGSLGKIRRLMRPNGLFFVDIVDFRAAYLRNWSVEGAVKIDHPYYFTEATAEALLRRAGFRIRQTNYSSDHLHVGYLCVPCDPQPQAMPAPEHVREFFREIRLVQNQKR